jgi:hypothetical protein
VGLDRPRRHADDRCDFADRQLLPVAKAKQFPLQRIEPFDRFEQRTVLDTSKYLNLRVEKLGATQTGDFPTETTTAPLGPLGVAHNVPRHPVQPEQALITLRHPINPPPRLEKHLSNRIGHF